MKKLFIAIAVLVFAAYFVEAQSFLDRLGNAARRSAENAVQNHVEQKVQENVENALNGQDKQENNQEQMEVSQDQGDQEMTQPIGWTCPKCGHQGNTGKFCTECGAKKPESNADSSWKCGKCGAEGNTGKFCNECGAAKGTQAASTSQWNRYDFVPGDRVIFEDNQVGEQLGEFPSQWDLLEGDVENVRFDGQNMISIYGGVIRPLMKDIRNYLGDTYTLEFDYYEPQLDEEVRVSTLNVNFVDPDESVWHYRMGGVYWEVGYSHSDRVLYEHPNAHGYNFWMKKNTEGEVSSAVDAKLTENAWHHIAISFNKRAMKVYLDENRIVSAPNVSNSMGWFNIEVQGARENHHPVYIKNVRMAEGAVPLYDRVVSDGKIVTYGITFDINKADIKPESMGEINRIVKLMQDDSSLKFEVQGHTDNTGNAANNQTLSEKSAKAIADKLVELGISADRLSYKGMGQSAPIADNATDEGKAKNRRVEFIKK